MHIENVLNSKYLLFVIGFIGIAGSLSERPMISSGALVFCVASAYGALAAKFDSLVSSVVFLLMPFVTGIGTLLFGSVVTPIPRALVVTASFIGLIFVSQLFGGPNNRLSVEQLFIPIGIFLISCLTNLFSTSKLVTFVAFGYDNFYHLAIFRNMANSRILLVGGEGLMSVVNSGPLGSGAALSMVCNVIGVNPLDVRQSVQFFAVISLIIPLMIFFVVHKLVKLLITESIPWLTSSLVGVVLFVGYPSHQWFSGFLHSNAGVLVVVVGLVTYLGVESKKLKSALLSIEVALLAFVYLIYAPLVIFLLVKVIFFDAQSEPKESRKTLVGHMSLALLATAFPSFLLSRSYGADHLFVGGGIEQLPQVPVALLLGYGMGLAYESTQHGINQRIRVLPQAVIFLVVFLVVLSIWQSGYISYYPTKISILLLILTLVFVVSETSFQVQRTSWNVWEKFARGGMLLFILSLLIWSGLSPNQYRTGDQGALRGVIAELLQPETESDRGKFILSLHSQAELIDRPVLVEMKGMDSEQMSRWVNSLGFRFSDATWTDWTSVRTNYSTGEHSIAHKIASGDPLYSSSGKGVAIATDNPKMLSDLRKIGPGVYGCLVNSDFSLICR